MWSRLKSYSHFSGVYNALFLSQHVTRKVAGIGWLGGTQCFRSIDICSFRSIIKKFTVVSVLTQLIRTPRRLKQTFFTATKRFSVSQL